MKSKLKRKRRSRRNRKFKARVLELRAARALWRRSGRRQAHVVADTALVVGAGHGAV